MGFRKSLTEETTSEEQIKEFSKILSNSTENLGEKNGPSILRMRFEVGFVLMSIIILVFRSCYTVYWEERQKKKKEKKLKEDIEMMQKIGKSTDNVFKVNTLEKNSNLQVVTQSTRLLEDEDNVF